MRKFFLIPVLALFACVSAWGVTRTAGTFAELQDALEAAAAGDVIELTADITWADHAQFLLIDKSISLDGKGKKITGYGNKQVFISPLLSIMTSQLSLKSLSESWLSMMDIAFFLVYPRSFMRRFILVSSSA